MTFSGSRVLLRLAKPSMARATLDYYTRNRDFLTPFDPKREERFYTLSGQRRYLRQDARMARKGEGAAFYISLKDAPERIIGRVVLSNIIWGSFRSCFLGYKLDGELVNRGYMTEAVNLVVDIAFEELRLHRIEANVMPRNLPSLRVMEKCGFQREGESPKYLEINGVWEDHVHMVRRNPALE